MKCWPIVILILHFHQGNESVFMILARFHYKAWRVFRRCYALRRRDRHIFNRLCPSDRIPQIYTFNRIKAASALFDRKHLVVRVIEVSS